MDPGSIMEQVSIWASGFSRDLLPVYIMPNLQLIGKVLLLLVAAYVFGRIGKFATVRLLNFVGLKKITTRSWAESLLRVTGYKGSIVELLGDLIKWLVYIISLTIVLQELGLTGMAGVSAQVALFVPRFIGGIMLLVIGFIIADFFGRVFEEAGNKILRDEGLGKLSGGVIKYSISITVLIMFLAVIGVDTTAAAILLVSLLAIIVVIVSVSIKDLMPELVSGLELKEMIKVGEKISVKGYTGIVEKMNPANTRIKTKKAVVIIPNSVLFREPLEKEK